jgi:hypothetical protein
MRMRDDQTQKIWPDLLNELRIGNDEINAHLLGASEADAAIDHDPAAILLWAKAVKR